MKNIISIALILCYNLTIAQENNIAIYFDLVNKAEIAICQSNYKTGLGYYQKAFRFHHEPFTKDYHNALICSVYNKDYKTAKECYIKLAERNYYLFDLREALSDIVDLKEWKKLESLDIPVKINFEYQEKLEALVKRDQDIRNYSIKKNPNNHYEHNKDTIMYIDSLNLAEFKELVKEYGFPTEDKIGNTYYTLILLHNLQWKRNNLNDFLYQETQKGNFHPYRYAKLYDYWVHNYNEEGLGKGEHYMIEVAFMINDQFFIEYTPQKQEINEFRKNIYIESLDDYYTQINFTRNNHLFKFVAKGAIMNWIGMDDKTANELIGNLKRLEKDYK